MDGDDGIDWVVVSSCRLIDLKFPSWSVVVLSFLHFESVRVCVPGESFVTVFIFDVLEIIHNNYFFSEFSHWNRINEIVDFDHVILKIEVIVESHLGIDMFSTEVNNCYYITNKYFLRFYGRVRFRVPVSINCTWPEDIGTAILSNSGVRYIVVEFDLEILGVTRRTLTVGVGKLGTIFVDFD